MNISRFQVFRALQISKYQSYVSKGIDFPFISNNLQVSYFLGYLLSVHEKAQASSLQVLSNF